MNRLRWIRALALRAFLLGLALSLLASTTPPPPPVSAIANNMNAKRPMQALYQIEAFAAQSGWTADLARSAGDIWEALNDLPRAVAYWEIALRAHPKDEQLTRRLAQAYLDSARWSQAVISLSNLLKLTDDNWAHFQLGILQGVLDSASAAEHFRLAARDPQYQSVATELSALQNEAADLNHVMHMGAILSAANQWPAAEYVF